jgi:hypothetical protein
MARCFLSSKAVSNGERWSRAPGKRAISRFCLLIPRNLTADALVLGALWPRQGAPLPPLIQRRNRSRAEPHWAMRPNLRPDCVRGIQRVAG